MSEKVKASLDIHFFVNCPHCGERIDLLDEEDTGGYNCDEEGFLLDQIIGPNPVDWERFECDEVTCTKCNDEFDVKGIEY